MERIFNQSPVGLSAGLQSDQEEGYNALVRAKIDDSISYEQEYLALAREENQAYYNGLEPSLGGVEEGEEREPINRSTFVSTDVRDTILTILPSLIRIFTSSEKVAEFTPTTEENTDMAEQAYDYANYVFMDDNPGFLILHSVIKDALTVKAGITKWWTDVDVEVKEQLFRGITPEQYQMLLYEMPDVEVLDLESAPDGSIAEVTFRYFENKPVIRVAAVPPDEFRIARDAKDIESASLVGHESIVPISDLVAKGYDPEELQAYVTSAQNYSDERFLRNPGLTDDKVDGVLYGEWFIRVDGDGDGIDELRKICTVGGNYQIISDEVVNHINFALWGSDPRPHTAIGDCMADITKDIQRMKTNMMRGQLDNLSEAIHPRTVVNELLTNIEDVLSDEVGAIIRTRGDPSTAVSFSKTPYSGAEVQVTVNYLDQVRASRTGITEASKGLDPKAMQSTALSGIDAIISGAQERIELIARVLAETGLKPMMKGILREIVNNPNQLRTVKLRGKWAVVNPSLFDPSMRVTVNPTLGKGSDMIRLQALSKIEQTQLTILSKYGLNNPVVSPIEFRNTQVDMLAIANIKNPARYFKEITEEMLAAIAQQPEEPDPTAVLAQAELEKVKKDIIIAGGKQVIDEQRLTIEQNREAAKVAKNKEDADFKRDKLNIDSMLELAKIFGETTVNATVPTGILSANQSN